MGKLRNLLDKLKPKRSVDPDDVADYYFEQKNRKIVAWALGAGTLILTVAITMALFYGVRWGYRQLFTNNDPPITETTPAQSEQNGETSSTDTDETKKSAKQRTKKPTSVPSTGDDLPATGDPGL